MLFSSRYFFIPVFLFLLLAHAHGQETKKCRSFDAVVESTVTAIRKNSSAQYLTAYNYDTTLAIFYHKSIADTSVADIHQRLQSNPNTWQEILVFAFDELMTDLKEEIKEPVKKVKKLSYSIERVEDDGTVKHNTVTVHLQVNAQKLSITMYVTQYHQCHYLLEPPQPYWTKD